MFSAAGVSLVFLGVLAVMVGYSGMFAVMALFPFVATIFFVVCYKKWDEKHRA